MNALAIAFGLLYTCILIGIALTLHRCLDHLLSILCMIHDQLERIADAEWVYNPCDEQREED